jgi:hypothetical protein
LKDINEILVCIVDHLIGETVNTSQRKCRNSYRGQQGNWYGANMDIAEYMSMNTLYLCLREIIMPVIL